MSRPTESDSSQVRRILIGTALLLILGMGMRRSFGLFLPPIARDLAITAADFTLSLAVQNSVWGLSQALIGAMRGDLRGRPDTCRD
jgi:hypothetical protein